MKLKSTFLLVLLGYFSLSIGFSQIPNAGFENWVNSNGHESPDRWSTPDEKTASSGKFICEKGMPGMSGNSYLKLTSTAITGMGVMPGVAVCGILDMTTLQSISGFAFSQRPKSLTGSWQHMIFGNTQGFISILLTKWNVSMQKRDTISYTMKALTGMAMSWSNFSIDLKYQNGSDPDSCIIFLSASGSTPTNRDYLWVDNLDFMGNATGISSLENTLSDICLYPNPVRENLNFNLGSIKDSQVNLQLMDLTGRIIKELQYKNVHQWPTYSISVSDLPQGIFLIKFMSENSTLTQRFIIE